jgi:hypothetical protein
MATVDKVEKEEFLLDEKTLREIETMKGAGQWSIVWMVNSMEKNQER